MQHNQQDGWPFGAHPGTTVQPSNQPKVIRLSAEILVAMAALDLTGVLAVSRWAFEILLGAGWIGNRQLGGQVFGHHGGNIRGIAQEGAEKANRAELKRVAKTVMIAAPDEDFGAVGIVQVEVAGHLSGRWIADVMAIAVCLFIGQEIDRHAPWSGIRKT